MQPISLVLSYLIKCLFILPPATDKDEDIFFDDVAGIGDAKVGTGGDCLPACISYNMLGWSGLQPRMHTWHYLLPTFPPHPLSASTILP